MSRCSVGERRGAASAEGPARSALPAARPLALLAILVGGLGGLGGLGALGACSDGDGAPPRCVTVDAACIPRYEPTFPNLYNNTLRDSCGSQSGVCHSAQGRRGGLSLESEATAYAELTAEGLGRVVAGDPSCSEVIVRLHGEGESYLMPPGAQLPASDRCAIERWIANGAMRSNPNPAPLAPPAGQGDPP